MSATTETTQAPGSTDRIETRFETHASRSRVWRAISNAKEFGTWFRVDIDDTFVPGKTVRGTMTLKSGELFSMEFQIDRIEPEHYFSYRWHPYPFDPSIDYTKEPPTLVEFRLEEHAGGTVVTIIESGFDQIPLARRAEAFRMHTQGWVGQAKNLGNHVA